MIRLLDCKEWKFSKFADNNLPETGYAILSHTWRRDAEEITYEEVKALCSDEEGKGAPQHDRWQKIYKAREAAANLGFKYIWIDTCCINKGDLPELTESINSMYRWYAQSTACIVYLSDLGPNDLFGKCRWWSRGWTLQEFIAPPTVFFYDNNWNYYGSKNLEIPRNQVIQADKSTEIAGFSGIDAALLQETDATRIKRSLASLPACQKMCWASKRDTSRPEDKAYCLIGIFDIGYMHLKYGEGENAFIRLQEEILKQSSDLTLFAWKIRQPPSCASGTLWTVDKDDLRMSIWKFDQNTQSQSFHGIFACHPSDFSEADKLQPLQHVMYNDEATITSKGVSLLNTPLYGNDVSSDFIMPLNCRDSEAYRGIKLRWVGGNVFVRTDLTGLADVTELQGIPNQDPVYLTTKIHHLPGCINELHKNSIRVPEKVGEFKRVQVSPSQLWSEKHQLFMTQGFSFPVGYAKYEDKDIEFYLLFGLDHKREFWSCLIDSTSHLAPSHTTTRRTYLNNVWREALELKASEIKIPTGRDNKDQMEIKSKYEKKEYRGQPFFLFELDLKPDGETTNSQTSATQRAARTSTNSNNLRNSKGTTTTRRARSHSRPRPRSRSRPRPRTQEGKSVPQPPQEEKVARSKRPDG